MKRQLTVFQISSAKYSRHCPHLVAVQSSLQFVPVGHPLTLVVTARGNLDTALEKRET